MNENETSRKPDADQGAAFDQAAYDLFRNSDEGKRKYAEALAEARRKLHLVTAERPPRPAEPIWDNIPEELTSRPRWVLRLGKVPKQRSGAGASSTDPETWAMFANVKAAYQAGGSDGVGIVLDGDGLLAFDFDHCLDANGRITDPRIEAYVKQLDSYTEISPSGTGLHVFALGTLPAQGRKKGPCEVYSTARYMTVTGRRFSNTPATVNERQDAINQVHAAIFPPAAPPEHLTTCPDCGAAPKAPTPTLDDAMLLNKAREATNGDKFEALFDRGDWQGTYPSQSEADLALCCMMAFWTRDADQIDRLFRSSKLMRPKWDREKQRTDTINKALTLVTEHYKGSEPLDEQPEPETKVNCDDLHGLPAAITKVRKGKGKPFVKNDRIATLTSERLVANEYLFCRTVEGCLYLFDAQQHRLAEIGSKESDRRLAALTGLSTTEDTFKFLVDRLKTAASQTPPREVHALAHYDRTTGAHTVSFGGADTLHREPGGEWVHGYNGQNDALFFTVSNAEPVMPVFNSAAALDKFLGKFLFADDGKLSREDQKFLLLVWLLHQFFPSLRRTRMIATMLGSEGSGKTSGVRLVGNLLIGRHFNVVGVSEKGEDAAIASLTNGLVSGFDNLDTYLKWLEDMLAAYGSGDDHQKRELYTTNNLEIFKLRAVLILASRNSHFKRPDIGNRIIPFKFEGPEEGVYINECDFYDELSRERPSILGELLALTGKIADLIANGIKPPQLRFRMADFAAFGWFVSEVQGRAAEWPALLERLKDAQTEFVSEDDSLVTWLREKLENAPSGIFGPFSTKEIFAQYNDEAEDEGQPLLQNPWALSKRLTGLRKTIERKLNVDWVETRGHADVRVITLVPRKPERDDHQEPDPTPAPGNTPNSNGGGDHTLKYSENYNKGNSVGNPGDFCGDGAENAQKPDPCPPSPDVQRAAEAQTLGSGTGGGDHGGDHAHLGHEDDAATGQECSEHKAFSDSEEMAGVLGSMVTTTTTPLDAEPKPARKPALKPARNYVIERLERTRKFDAELERRRALQLQLTEAGIDYKQLENGFCLYPEPCFGTSAKEFEARCRAPESSRPDSVAGPKPKLHSDDATRDQTLAIAAAESIAHALVAIGFAKRLADDAARGFKRERRSSRGRYRAKF